MNTRAAITEIEARAARSEAAALESQIQLGITRARLAELEATAVKRSDMEATRAVQVMVDRGVIRREDTFRQHEYKAMFITDPGLIILAITKPYNQRKRAKL